MSKDIVKALVTKKFSEAKDLVFQALYAKSALAMDDARMSIASSVFNAPTEQVEEGTGGIYDDDNQSPPSKPKPRVPAGASKPPHKVRLGKGVPAGAMKEDVEEVNELDDSTYQSYTKKASDRIGELKRKRVQSWVGTGHERAMGREIKKRESGVDKAKTSLEKSAANEKAKPFLKRVGNRVKKVAGAIHKGAKNLGLAP